MRCIAAGQRLALSPSLHGWRDEADTLLQSFTAAGYTPLASLTGLDLHAKPWASIHGCIESSRKVATRSTTHLDAIFALAVIDAAGNNAKVPDGLLLGLRSCYSALAGQRKIHADWIVIVSDAITSAEHLAQVLPHLTNQPTKAFVTSLVALLDRPAPDISAIVKLPSRQPERATDVDSTFASATRTNPDTTALATQEATDSGQSDQSETDPAENASEQRPFTRGDSILQWQLMRARYQRRNDRLLLNSWQSLPPTLTCHVSRRLAQVMQDSRHCQLDRWTLEAVQRHQRQTLNQRSTQTMNLRLNTLRASGFNTVLASAGLCALLSLGSAHADTKTRTTRFDYDAAGLLSKTTSEPLVANDCLQVTYGRDTFGNQSSTSTAACPGATGDAISSAATARTSSTSYGADGRFATSSANALSQSETRVYDLNTGTFTSLTGPNGLSTSRAYDSFKRKTRETRADGTYTTWAYKLCTDAGADCPGPIPAIAGAVSVMVVIEQSYGANAVVSSPQSRSYIDALGRTLRVQTQGFDGQSAAPTLVSDTEYNARGQPHDQRHAGERTGCHRHPHGHAHLELRLR